MILTELPRCADCPYAEKGRMETARMNLADRLELERYGHIVMGGRANGEHRGAGTDRGDSETGEGAIGDAELRAGAEA